MGTGLTFDPSAVTFGDKLYDSWEMRPSGGDRVG